MSSPATQPSPSSDRRRLGAEHAALRRHLREADRERYERVWDAAPVEGRRSERLRAGSLLPLATCAVVGIAMMSAGDAVRPRPSHVSPPPARTTDYVLPSAPTQVDAPVAVTAVPARSIRRARTPRAASVHRVRRAEPRAEQKRGFRIRFKWDKPFG